MPAAEKSIHQKAAAFTVILALLFYQNIQAQESTPKLILPIGHTNSVVTVAFSPDGKYVVTSSWDRTAKVWEFSSGRLLHSLEGHVELLTMASFSPDGKYVATASKDHTAKLWDARNGQLLFTFSKEAVPWNTGEPSVLFADEGKKILTLLGDGVVKVWDIASGKQFATFKGDYGIDAMHGSLDGRLVATSSDDSIRVWNLKTGRHISTLNASSGQRGTALFSLDGRNIITTFSDSTARIWETFSGKALRTISAKPNFFLSAEFTPDGKYVLTQSSNASMQIWNCSSGQVLQSFAGETPVALSPDGLYVITYSRSQNAGSFPDTKTATLRELATGKMLATPGDYFRGPATFSPDSKYVAITGQDYSLKIWDMSAGKFILSFEGKAETLQSAHFNHDGSQILTASYRNARVLDTRSGALCYTLGGHTGTIWSAEYSPDDKTIITAGGKNAMLWDVTTGKVKSVLTTASTVTLAQFSPSGNYIFTRSGKTAQIWESLTGKLLSTLENTPGAVRTADFSRDEKQIITACKNEKHACVRDVQSGKMLFPLQSAPDDVASAEFSPDGHYVLTTSYLFNEAQLWNAEDGKLLRTLTGHRNLITDAEFSPDSQFIVTASYDSTAIIWSVLDDKNKKVLKGHRNYIYTAQFTQDAKQIVTNAADNTTKIWDAQTGKLITDLSIVGTMADMGATRMLLIENSRLMVYDLASGSELFSYYPISEREWVVTHPSGLFDASPGAMDKLYFVQGLDVIQFDQLKDRYYEPGLLKKVTKGEALRSVVGFKSIDLPPDIRVGQVNENGYLSITLTNRGGGIGEVNVFVNGKEVIRDAREANTKPDAPSATLSVFVANSKTILKGQENLIGVKAWNKDHWVVSRGQLVSYSSKEVEQYKPAVHILTCGISDYTGTEIDLKYAAKDANDVSQALQLGAKKLFGAEKSYVYNLTTSQSKDFYPTKTNILKAFEHISATAHPLDVFVMYVSGHGLNFGGQDGDWYYLTQEAYTASASAYNDPAIRAQTTISSNELVELFKKVPALKQVLILDACASGKVVDNLMGQKDIESSTLRALDRMRDRTGMHIITGCTADAVSYEASKYGQGVLTYSLLEGIRGAALREDQFVDVVKLFQYAQDRVPKLAEGIGGIQSPQVFSPQGSQSFDIGLLSEWEKKEIPIAKIRPVFIRSSFQDENELEDVLGLGKLINAALNEASSRGVDPGIIFVDVADYPEGCKLIGRYWKDKGKIFLKLRRKCGGEDRTYDLAADTAEGLKAEIMKVL